MKWSVLVVVLAVGCQKSATPIHAEQPLTVDAAPEIAIDDAAPEADQVEAAPPIPARTATRTRFATHTLTMAEHGIDGTFELWRDSRLDDDRVDKEWFGGGLEMDGAKSAQVVLRDARRVIVESLDLELPLAKMSPVRLGDDAVPYLEIAIDTYAGVGRWGGTTHKFVRVEGGHSRWLGCAETYRCALGCRFHYDPRPGGGVDILAWRHWYAADVITPVTNFSRIEIGAGACKTTTRTVKDWVGEEGSGTAIMIPADFPPRR